MTVAESFINNPPEFWKWLVGTLDQIPNPKSRDPEFLFGIGEDTWEKYRGFAIDASVNGRSRDSLTLPQGKHLKKIVMSRAFDLMSPADQRILIRVWCDIAIESAGKGTAPSEEFIEFIGFILRKCPEHLLQKGVKAVRGLPH